MKQASLDDRNSAALHFLDAVAWEYMSSRSAAEFEALVRQIAETAIAVLDVQYAFNAPGLRFARGSGQALPFLSGPSKAGEQPER